MKLGIYLIVNMINEKYYVGSTNNSDTRYIQHKSLLNRNVHWNAHLQSAWNKYGQENFNYYIIEYVYDNETLLEREKYWIAKLDSTNIVKGYNLCKVGRNQAGIKRSEEVIRKNAIGHTGLIHTEETKAKIGASKVGKKRKPFSEEWKQKISLKAKGRKLSEESKKLRAERIKHKKEMKNEQQTSL